jgi:uncharacterized protein (TIGR00369 family)
MSPAEAMQTLDPALAQQILERIRQIPIFDAIGVQIERFAPGECVATVPRNPAYDGIFESFHGGLLMTVADTIACFAIMTQTGPDEVLTTTDMNIRFLGPCLTAVTAHARVIKLGRSLCPVAVDLLDASGKPVAVAQVCYMRLPKMPSR